MTIDDYLKQYEYLKGRADLTYIKMSEAEDRANNIRCGLNLDGTPRTKGGRPNGHETALIEAADALKECMAADKALKAYEKQLKGAINSLLYWEGCIITRIYIYNVRFERPPVCDINDIVADLDDKRATGEYISTAKAHLAEILRARGVEIS